MILLFALVFSSASSLLQVQSFQYSAFNHRSPLFHSIQPSCKRESKRNTATPLPMRLDISLKNENNIYNEDGRCIDDDDTLLKFSKDVKTVMHDIRGSPIDPTISEYLLQTSSKLTYSKTWTLDDWDRHNSRRRYLRYLMHFPKSRTLKRITPQLSALCIWSCLAVWIEKTFLKKKILPISALGTLSTFLAFLLTLRSNQGLSRLDEGRRIWSKVVLNTREMSQLISQFIYPVDKQLGLMLARHVALFGWLLKSELRFTSEEEVADIVRTMLPNKSDADFVLSQRQKTNAVVTRIRQVIHHLAEDHRLSTAEEIALDHTAQSLSEVITAAGRIRTTPIPTLYTSHASRLLMFYLGCLPLGLHCSGLTPKMTVVITMVVGYAMIGLDEISHLFEFPFRVIPMYEICKRSMLAVADAFTCRPPPLQRRQGQNSNDEDDKLTQKELTTYWAL